MIESHWKFAVQREVDCVWLTVFEGGKSAAVKLSYGEARMLGSLILPDGGEYLDRATTLGASYEVAIPAGFENLPEDLIAAELAKSDKYVKLTSDAIGGGGLDGGVVHESSPALAPRLLVNESFDK